jgi:hypothetical protein
MYIQQPWIGVDVHRQLDIAVPHCGLRGATPPLLNNVP